ncbi:cytochrome-c peroxidase [Aliterella atlantica]|nr:cytochrome c peroxidase [Aliterella atlantica]
MVATIAAQIATLRQLLSNWSNKVKRYSAIAALVVATILAGHTVSAQIIDPGPSQPLASLKTVSIPEPDNLKDFVQNKTAAIALGKSLFWDMQLGSDGIQSCASCHFHAGADNRSKNQLNPGAGNVFDIGGNPNYQLTAADYPFHKLSDSNNRSSTVIADSNDITGDQGVFKAKYVDVNPGSAQDIVTPLKDDVFNVNSTNVRQVTGRNSPSTINAVFNFRNFWDGRAQNIFNGVNEFGSRDPNAFVLKATNPNRILDVRVNLKNSSLASQAVGPPLSAFETAAESLPIAPLRATLSETTGEVTVIEATTQEVIKDSSGVVNVDSLSGVSSDVAKQAKPPKSPKPSKPLRPLKRVGRKLGKKLTVLRPLGKQLVATDDSVLGSYSRASQLGLNVATYATLIQQAFKPEWWRSNLIVQVDPTTGDRTILRKPAGALSTIQYTLMEYNFSLFFGLAVQAYESTLVSNNSPFDQYFDGNASALSDRQKRGLEVFQNQGKCINCHGGAEFTNASVKNVKDERLERMIMGDSEEAIYDNGFYNIAVRPTSEDLGVGGNDPFGNPLSESRLAQKGLFEKLLGEKPNIKVSATQRIAADGAFKTPGLRNVELTAPYFHNGGQLTLEQVVEFYNRGGDFHEQNIDNLDADIQNLNLSAENKADLVDFLKSLTDDRVRYQRAPFDHPQLFVPNGHPGDRNSNTDSGNAQATDQLLEIPAVGRNGGNSIINFLASSQ